MSKNFFFVNRAGVEPTTYALEVRCSIQLSYRSLFLTLQRYEINLVLTSFIFHLRKFIWWTWRDSNPRPDKETKSLIHKLSLFFLTNKIDTLLHCSIINVQLDFGFSWVPPLYTFFLTPHDVCGESYAASAYSAPTNAIASSKVKLEISLPFKLR
jgi:hypothetical protein